MGMALYIYKRHNFAKEKSVDKFQCFLILKQKLHVLVNLLTQTRL